MTENAKIVERIRGLRRMAEKGSGATEAEAQSFSDKADELMKAYGIEQGEIELRGGTGEARAKDGAGVVGLGREDWSKELMSAIAESCFCEAFPKFEIEKGKQKLSGFTLYGRKSAVITAQLMLQYLYRTVIRLSRAERGSQRFFRFGCADRIADRIRERHQSALAEQRQQASQTPPGATRNALVVVLEDYAQNERDANRDFQRGVAPGTTRREREERKTIQDANRIRYQELEAAGILFDIAFWMIERGMTLEEAKTRDTKYKEETSNQKPSRPYIDRTAKRRESSSYAAGSRAGDNVGLDPQVSTSSVKKLT